MGRLAGRIAVVTGASKGIGAAIAERLAAEGASVIVNYLTSAEGAARVVGGIQAAGGSACAVCADVSTEAGIATLFSATVSTYGRLDILVNNAGVYAFGPLESVTSVEYTRQFDLNVKGLLLTTKAAVPLFPAAGGSIINIGSVVGTLAPATASISAANKAAVDAITKCLAKELGPRRIRVNSINPGVVMTEGFVAAGLAGSDFEKHAVALTPLGRVGVPGDIAPVAAFLASDEARWISGETIKVAGGE
jgi:3-oxoacyl-[acyl-carrier protein] reductase